MQHNLWAYSTHIVARHKCTVSYNFVLFFFLDEVVRVAVPGLFGAVRSGDCDDDGGAHEQDADHHRVRVQGAGPGVHLLRAAGEPGGWCGTDAPGGGTGR